MSHRSSGRVAFDRVDFGGWAGDLPGLLSLLIRNERM